MYKKWLLLENHHFATIMEITNLGKNQKRMLKLAHTIQKRILKLVKSGEEQDIYITSKYLLTKSSLIYKRKTIFPEKSGRHYLDQVIQAQVSNHGIMIMFPLKLSTDDTSQRNVLPKLHHLNLISRKHHTYPNWEAMYKAHDLYFQQCQGHHKGWGNVPR